MTLYEGLEVVHRTTVNVNGEPTSVVVQGGTGAYRAALEFELASDPLDYTGWGKTPTQAMFDLVRVLEGIGGHTVAADIP